MINGIIKQAKHIQYVMLQIVITDQLVSCFIINNIFIFQRILFYTKFLLNMILLLN